MTEEPLNTDSLEGIGLTPAADVDLHLLQEAANFQINLDELEKPAVQSEPKAEKPREQNEVWRQLDIKLSDVINLIMATSERPTFMVRDDVLVYLNPAAERILDIKSDRDVTGDKFLNLVVKEDWNLLAENIGEMLTNNKSLKIRLKSASGKIRGINFQAIYLSEIEHFSFILLGEHIQKTVKPAFNNLYDDLTGLPNFFLFEDRVQVAIAQENAKENPVDVNMIAVLAISIDNIESFRKMHIEDEVVKKTANKLVLNLPKSTTVAQGLKYHFWILLTGLKNKAEINHEVRKVAEMLNDGVSDNFTRHELLFSIGASSFPQPAHSAKKIIEQAIAAIKKAQEDPKSSMEFFVNDEAQI